MATVVFLRLRGVVRARADAALDCFAELAKRVSPQGWTKAGPARSMEYTPIL
jgi:hypothetical protein